MTLFQTYGELSDVTLPLDDTKRPKGFAFIQYLFPEHAVQAMSALDGSVYMGRILHVLPGDAARESNKDNATEGTNNKTYKSEKEEERKKNSNDSVSWNSLFIRSDTVLSAIAEKLNVNKVIYHIQ